VALVLLIASIGVGVFHERGYQQEAANNTRQYAAYAEYKVGEACAGVAAPQLSHCRAEARAEGELEKRQYEHDEADLIAQRKAALWTSIMGIAALLGMGLSIVGVVLVYVTFRATRDGNKISERIGEAQTRAYMSVTACKLTFRDGKPSIRPTIRNSGQSPALAVRWQGTIHISPDGDYPVGSGETDPEFRNHTLDIPAQGEREALYYPCVDFALSRADLEAFTNDIAVVVIVAVEARGKDVFGNPISGADEFIHVLHKPPVDLKEFKMTLGTPLNPETEEEGE
jgi:hypothetical protein